MIYKVEEISINETNWGWAAANGLLLLLLGIALAIYPLVSMLISFSLVAVFWLITGIVSVVSAVKNRNEESGRIALAGVISIVAALVVLAAPLIATGLTVTFAMILLGVTSLFNGLITLVGTSDSQDEAREDGLETEEKGNRLVIGISNLLIGIIFVASPLMSAIAVSIFAGVFAVMGGVWLLIKAFGARSQSPGKASRMEVVTTEEN